MTVADWFFPAGYIGEFEEIDDHRSGKIVIQLNGRFVSLLLTAGDPADYISV